MAITVVVSNRRNGCTDLHAGFSNSWLAFDRCSFHGCGRTCRRRHVSRSGFRHEPAKNSGYHVSNRREFREFADAEEQSVCVLMVVSQGIHDSAEFCWTYGMAAFRWHQLPRKYLAQDRK